MLHMSFFTREGNDKLQPFNDDKIEELVKTTNKEIKWRQGLNYRGAHAVPITREEALEVITNDFLDVHEYEDYVLLNTYSSNDMW